MALAWDGDHERLVIEAQALVECRRGRGGPRGGRGGTDQGRRERPAAAAGALTGALARAFAKRALAWSPPAARRARSAAFPWTRKATSARAERLPRRRPERVRAAGGTAARDRASPAAPAASSSVRGRLADASNATLLLRPSALRGRRRACVYKPVAGERPLWDFPDGTLAQREVAAYLVSEATGWGIVPPTVLRDGPFGPGMSSCGSSADRRTPARCSGSPRTPSPSPAGRRSRSAEVDEGRTALLVHADDERLRRIAVLDAVINNADRKGGHLLPAADGQLYGIDHGVSFPTEDKLRTLLWGWAGEPLPDEAVDVLDRLAADLEAGLAAQLAELLTPAEIAALRARVDRLLATGRHPEPGSDGPPSPGHRSEPFAGAARPLGRRRG